MQPIDQLADAHSAMTETGHQQQLLLVVGRDSDTAPITIRICTQHPMLLRIINSSGFSGTKASHGHHTLREMCELALCEAKQRLDNSRRSLADDRNASDQLSASWRACVAAAGDLLSATAACRAQGPGPACIAAGRIVWSSAADPIPGFSGAVGHIQKSGLLQEREIESLQEEQLRSRQQHQPDLPMTRFATNASGTSLCRVDNTSELGQLLLNTHVGTEGLGVILAKSSLAQMSRGRVTPEIVNTLSKLFCSGAHLLESGGKRWDSNSPEAMAWEAGGSLVALAFVRSCTEGHYQHSADRAALVHCKVHSSSPGMALVQMLSVRPTLHLKLGADLQEAE